MDEEKKRFVVYYDEGIYGGPKTEIRTGYDVNRLFPSGEGWENSDIQYIERLGVDESMVTASSGVTYTVKVWRVN